MNYSGLSCFLTIAETGSFSAAAVKLYISQPALSQRIRTLENQLGFKLFLHNTHRATLTPAGRAFLPQAKRLMDIYYNAVQQGRFIANEVRTNQHCLRIGCLGEQIFSIWIQLYRLSEQVQSVFSPVAMRFQHRAELYSALNHGKADLTFQMEDEDIAAFQLEFVPVVHIQELCVPFYVNNRLPKSLCLQDLFSYRIAFHYAKGHTIYEDALRRELSDQNISSGILEPEDFFNADYGIPSLLLIPRLSLTNNLSDYATPLEWKEGISAGFVFSLDCNPHIKEYVRCLHDYIIENGNPWA